MTLSVWQSRFRRIARRVQAEGMTKAEARRLVADGLRHVEQIRASGISDDRIIVDVSSDGSGGAMLAVGYVELEGAPPGAAIH